MTAASQHAAMSRAAAATTNSTTTATCLARPRDFSTTPGRPFHTSRPWAKEQEPPATKVQEADGPSVAAKAEVEVEPKEPLPQDLESELVANNEDYERDPALYEDVAEEAVEDIHTDLVIPPPRHDDNIAPKPHDLEQGGVVDYTPAQSADGLEVVGGLSGWFKNDKHIPKSKLEAFERFAPEEQVLDQSVLEFCVRRAVIEATVLISGPGDTDLLLRSWGGRSNAEAAKRVQALNVKVNKKGGPKLVGDQDLARVVVADLAAQDEASSDTQVSYPSPEEARKLCAEFDGSWKKISLENAQFRFAVGLLCLFARLLSLQRFPRAYSIELTVEAHATHRLPNESTNSPATVSPTPS